MVVVVVVAQLLLVGTVPARVVARVAPEPAAVVGLEAAAGWQRRHQPSSESVSWRVLPA